MSSSPSYTRAGWLVVLGLSVLLVVALGFARSQRVRAVTTSAPAEVTASPASETGYTGNLRTLVIPEPASESCQWIMQTQRLLAQDAWRLHRIDYENAPYGRSSATPSFYRWWLLTVAWAERALHGTPPGLSVERAALAADPILHLVLLLAGSAFVAWRFGALAATATAAALACLFPFAGSFQAGAPDDLGLALGCALVALWLLFAGLTAPAGGRVTPWFVLAGVVGGVGLWVSPTIHTILILGVSAGALLAGLWTRAANDVTRAPWPIWAMAGAITTFVCYLIEYAPDGLGLWQLRAIHPLYALAWLGLGMGLQHVMPGLRREPAPPQWSRYVGLGLTVLLLAALPVAMKVVSTPAFLATDLTSFRLTRLFPGTEGASLPGWLRSERFSFTVWATLVPLLLAALAVRRVLRLPAADPQRARFAFLLGPVVLTALFACWQLQAWALVDAVLIVLLIPLVGDATLARSGNRWGLTALVVLTCLSGVIRLLPPRGPLALDGTEVAGLVERDLAHWLAKRVGPNSRAVVLAPPVETTALNYYGGLRGVATLSRDNADGLSSAIRVLSATTPQEAQALIERRGITHLVLPSWDHYFAEYVRAGTGQTDAAFLASLRNWSLPAWLRPVPYQVPNVGGFEGQSVAVFEVVPDQSEAVSFSRLAVYFVELGRLDYARALERELQRFPADLGATVARAEVQLAANDRAALEETVRGLNQKIAAGADRALPWERRVGLAVVLATLQQTEAAREQAMRCFRDINEARVRGLSTESLYRLLVLGKLYNLSIVDPALRAIALDLVPAESREKL